MAPVRRGTSASAISVRRQRSATATTTIAEPFAADLVMVTGDLMTEKLQAYRRMNFARPDRASGFEREASRRIELPSGSASTAAAAENQQVPSRDRPIGISVPWA